MNKKQEKAILVRRCFSLLIIDFVCEIAYVILPLRTTYSRFTSTTSKRDIPFILPRDIKYAVELAVISARFSPSGQPVSHGGLIKTRRAFTKTLKILYLLDGVSQN
jgi:hypothetical protein